MSGKPVSLGIPPDVMLLVFREARGAYPAECCGWLTGAFGADLVDSVRPCSNAQSDGDHPTAADRSADTAYVIAGDDLLALSKSLDSDRPARIIYHSHPNGSAYFSDTDRTVATSPWGGGPAFPVQQLVVGLDDKQIVEAALFGWSEQENGFVEIKRYEGAAL